MYLTPTDFTIQNGELVKINDQGYTFVFFYTSNCIWCKEIAPIFLSISNLINGVNFAYMDVSLENWKIRDMSLRTNSHIDYVPLFILYVNGRKKAQFFQDEENVQNNFSKMQNFIMYNTQQQQSTRIRGAFNHENSEIPPYSIGIPGNLASRKVCKIYNNAYMKK